MLSGNAGAARLLGDARVVLEAWVAHTNRVTGVSWAPLDISDLASMAVRVAGQVQLLAKSERAGELYADIARDDPVLVARIERCINRPQPPRFCGPCPGEVEHGHEKGCEKRHPHVCGTALMAKRDAIEVSCPACKATHNVERLIKRLLADVDHWRFDRSEIELIMKTLEEPINPRSFRAWRKQGRIKPAGYRAAAGGRITVSQREHDDVPLYRLSAVRELNAELRRVTA
ncbi:MAG: hypothetical protein U5N53_28440 [Mycobacterium sp.]|nr:hypothetical protein [Mycobacterium sp.]